MIHYLKHRGTIIQLEQPEDRKNETIRILMDIVAAMTGMALIGILMIMAFTF